MKTLLLTILVTLVGCASPRYYTTSVPEFSYSQISHEQKVYKGQTKEEALRNFGAPTRSQLVTLGFMDEPRIEIEYLYSVWCSMPSCRIYVNPKTGLVTSYQNFHYQYTKELADD